MELKADFKAFFPERVKKCDISKSTYFNGHPLRITMASLSADNFDLISAERERVYLISDN